MGRELKRKEAKRMGKDVKKINEVNDTPYTPRTFITIIIVLLLFFAILYILTGLFVTKELHWFDKNNNSAPEQVITNKILAVDSLNQSEEVYYVYYYDTKKENSEVASIISSIKDKVYKVDLSEGFNTGYIGTPSGKVDNIKDLKVSDPTLIKVVNKNIDSIYTGKEEIKKVLN